jgi:para-aminobenzoate synthetase component 1
MIKFTEKTITTPSMRSLFHCVVRFRGISLFSASTGDDREYTGLNPQIIITGKTLQKGKSILPIDNPLQELENLLKEYSDLNEEISLLGYITYDFKDRFEEQGLYKRRQQNHYEDFYFALYEHYVISVRGTVNSRLLTVNYPFEYRSSDVEKELQRELPSLEQLPKKSYYKGTSLNKEEYKKAVKQTIDYIKNGDIYQANITRAIYGETEYTAQELGLKLYESNCIPFGVFASVAGGYIISTSPELFFRTENGKISASPIKGTITRSPSVETDTANKEKLLDSEKERAELVMIVDLLRNDISHLCLPGTVKVPRFPQLMTLENVYHLYADITGELLPSASISRILKKIFPGGSVTGCPKIRACQIIDKLEPVPRGVYTGSFGRISFNGNSVFNIMIRSLIQNDSQIIFNVGGGITLLSDPEKEYEETIHKGRNIWRAINMENIREEQYCIED